MGYNFIADFMEFAGETESPPSFLRWAALFPLAVAAGRRYFTKQGSIIHTPQLCLVFTGPSGVKKSYAKDLAMELVFEALPDAPLGADITSMDALINVLASDVTERQYTNHEGVQCEWHPLTIFVDEIANFMTYHPGNMINFLVAIYGRTRYKCITIKRKEEYLVEPCVNILSCCVPEWILFHLKTGILAGGWSRRFIVLYEPKMSDKNVSWPLRPDVSSPLYQRMINHLRNVENNAKEYLWTEEAKQYLHNWYIKNKQSLPDDKHLQAYYLTKDMHINKLCILNDLASEHPKYLITSELLEISLAFLEVVENHLPELYLAGGRNELAVEQQRVIMLLEKHGGGLPKKDFMRMTQKDLSPLEQQTTIRFLEDSGQIAIARNVDYQGRKTDMIVLISRLEKLTRDKGVWQTKN